MKAWLMKNKHEAIFTSSQSLRSKVKDFALQSKDQVVINLRAKYKKEIAPADKKTWEEYWDLMGKKGTWVDHIFIQMTAWYMNLDIMILTTSSRSEDPFIHLSGNIKETLRISLVLLLSWGTTPTFTISLSYHMIIKERLQ